MELQDIKEMFKDRFYMYRCIEPIEGIKEHQILQGTFEHISIEGDCVLKTSQESLDVNIERCFETLYAALSFAVDKSTEISVFFLDNDKSEIYA